VSGRLVVRDPLVPGLRISNLWVGVTAPDYTPPPRGFGFGFGRRGMSNAPAGGGFTNFPGRGPGGGFARGGFPPVVDWQRDAKFYQFWTRGDDQGRFVIRNVRPGSYTLHAIADGVLGEFTLTNVTVAVSQTNRLADRVWTPVRHGRTLWEIGVPDRTAREFRHGDHYWQWGLYFEYPEEFTNDVNFVIGQSDWRRDWNYVQPPRIETRDVPATGEDDENQDNGPQLPKSGLRNVRSTTWSVRFEMTNAPQGRATLRLAFCGTHQGCNVEVLVNGKSVGETGVLPSTSAMQRDGIRAYWLEKALPFDAHLLKPGNNLVELLSHAGSWSQGVMYDYLRLELDEARVANPELESRLVR
jgi:rhamnogalacturonan endolyase